jgi:ribokinase
MPAKRVLVVGSSVVDLTFYTQRIPAIGETIKGRFKPGLGGKGFNQAVASARSGAPTAFVSAVGHDSFAPDFAARLEELGIPHGFETIPGEATGAAAICVDESGRNNIIVALGANERLSPAFLDRNQALFDDTAVLLLQLETNLEVIDHALELVRRKSPGAITILNPAPGRPDIPAHILSMVDFLTPNETELEIVSGGRIARDEDLPSLCEAIPLKGAVLATLGEKGCYYFRKGGASRFFPAFSVQAIDTTGAGDAFNGGFASGLLQSSGRWEEAIRFASAVAALSVTKPGTSASMPAQEEVQEFLRTH